MSSFTLDLFTGLVSYSWKLICLPGVFFKLLLIYQLVHLFICLTSTDYYFPAQIILKVKHSLIYSHLFLQLIYLIQRITLKNKKKSTDNELTALRKFTKGLFQRKHPPLMFGGGFNTEAPAPPTPPPPSTLDCSLPF